MSEETEQYEVWQCDLCGSEVYTMVIGTAGSATFYCRDCYDRKYPDGMPVITYG